jgi:Na+-driven multidrug efflux pump
MRKVPSFARMVLYSAGAIIPLAIVMAWMHEAQVEGYWVALPVGFAVGWAWALWVRGRYRVWKNRHEIKQLRRELAEMEDPNG